MADMNIMAGLGVAVREFPLTTGKKFNKAKMQWPLAIKDHIASSLMIEQDDFEYAPFNQFGGIGRAYELSQPFAA